MSSTSTAVERQDIHKSCRTIEALLSVLNDYCEAASAFAAVQKKLAKALKEAAGLKTNVQFAGGSILCVTRVPQPRTAQPTLSVRVPAFSTS